MAVAYDAGRPVELVAAARAALTPDADKATTAVADRLRDSDGRR